VITLDGFHLLAGYNRWTNRRLYAACATLSDEERKKDRKAFFRSIHGTLNHLLLGDRAWLGRFTARPIQFRSLDEELFGDFAELRRERDATDAAIEAFTRELTEDRLREDIAYATTAGKAYRHPLGPALLHLFNHQAHHRGQVTTMLSQLGVDPGATDLIVYYREAGERS
jgi:uncharacterized damage-inducible protein DinB